MTEGMLKLMGVFAELERNMISQRVKSGMEHAKAKGKIVGRPATTENNIPHIFYKHYPKYKKGEINKKELSRLCSLSYQLWYNDKSEPKNPLFYMAKDLLAFMGEDELSDSQKIDVCQGKDDGIDILVNLRGLNRVLVIDHRIGSMQYEDEVTDYRKCLLRSKKVLGIDESVKIRTVLFHTYYCSDFYHDVMADCKINKESFLSVIEKYENVNRSLDIYIDSLRERIVSDASEERDWQYKKAMNYENYLNDNLSHSRIAQYNFIRDIFRSYYPESMWKQNSDTFKIQQGDDSDGKSPWTEFPFIEGINSDSKINYY